MFNFTWLVKNYTEFELSKNLMFKKFDRVFRFTMQVFLFVACTTFIYKLT